MLVSAPSWAAHAYAQFGDIKYPAGFSHFDYVNPAAPKGGEFRLVPGTTSTNFDKFNPFTLKGSAPPGLGSLMFESLLVGNSEEPTTSYGLLAEDVEVPADRLSATFRINPAARFNDGSPVMAEDVKYSFETLTGPQAAPQFRTIYAEVKGVTVVAPRTVRFDFVSANAELPLVVGSMAVFSRKWGGGKPFDQITTDLPISSGPYRLASNRLGRDITYQRDPKYWGADLPVRRGHFNFDRINFKLYLDQTAQFEGLKAGEFDFKREFISRNWARQYKGKPFDSGDLKKQVFTARNPGDFQGYVFNLRDARFQDVRVRQAIALAMDFEWMNRQLFFGIYKRVDGYFSNSDFHAHDLPDPGELALLEPLRDKLSPAVFGPAPVSPSTAPPSSLRDNLRQARDLLTAAGWTYRDGALRNAKGQAFTIEVLNNQPSLARVMAPMQAALVKLGIVMDIRNVDPSLYQQRMDNFEFEMTTIRLPGSTAPGGELFEYFGSKAAATNGSSNIWGIADPAVDVLLGKVVKATTRDELATAMRALDRVLSNGYYSVPQWYSDGFLVGYRQRRFVLPPIVPPYYQVDSWALSTWWASPENR
ncbi:extracellular solute-binding protein [Xylophilus sp. GOD-11R]|uniref:extracellular solute-binding protein n=1 Tax=Xylophilus sp. GOD-11R TaxID=3089814 RepID=UPI00298BE504|nr:extracellular solute-binding protein [Xylophilus sp. GOD-11R]WPB58871.1 extracellular solute-binding protein [Xylophilus sp. GOD-11R]